jgi:platelet-activating factor acetylhydrolase IB subunit alpha
LTDRQRADLHAGIYDYLLAQSASGGGGPSSEAFARAAVALHDADPGACSGVGKAQLNGAISPSKPAATPLLEKKWVAIPRLQKKVMELERLVAQSAKIHAHRGSSSMSPGDDSNAVLSATGGRRMLPRQPYTHKLQGHSAVVTCVAVHPVFTLAASGSEDGTIKVRFGPPKLFVSCLVFNADLTFSGRRLLPRFGTTRVENS